MSLADLEEFDRAAQFPVARRGGYGEAEVDAFVQRTRAAIEELSRRLSTSESSRRELEARLAAASDGTSAPASARALKLLEMAEQSANAAVEDAQRAARELYAEAEERAVAREEAAREAVLAMEAASRARQQELQEVTADLLESERAARLQVHDLAQRLTALLQEQPRGDVPVQQSSNASQ